MVRETTGKVDQRTQEGRQNVAKEEAMDMVVASRGVY